MSSILTYDSGFGGLSVFRHLVEAFPFRDQIYVADDAVFPIGNWPEDRLVDHCVMQIGALIETYRPELVVIACNTASTLALLPLRMAHDVAFVGTVPAIKPAAQQTGNGLISVLATSGTVKRDYTRALMDTYASHCEVTLVGSDRLAVLAEAYIEGHRVDERAICDEIAPCFVETPRGRTDVVVLACTHYPLLLEVFEKIAPWPVAFIDPAPAIARRALDLADNFGKDLTKGKGRRQFVRTSGTRFPATVAAAFSDIG